MHVHACHGCSVRTTIEITDDQRARLIELAARRHEKGFSKLIGDALEHYLADQYRHEAVARAMAAKASLDATEADELERSVAEIRRSWR
jgi:predicted transcriptional regulator